MYGGGGANKPLTNSLKTLPKNSNPKKIQDSKKSKLQSLQKDSKIQESQKDSKTISKIGISIIASVLLSQNLVAADLPKNALPAGGKFIHGSGNISIKNGNIMNIEGKNTNHVIAWGGGFNIGKDAEVKFNTSHGRQAAFLNLDYTNKASKILGKLNGNNHNIYLVNPSGVLIGQGASVNANKFVASTSSLDKALTDFTKNAPDDKNVATFSPVFSPNEVRGNIVNMGNITAGDIILVGKEVRNRTYVKDGDRNGVLGNFNHTGSLKIVGNKIFLDADGTKNINSINLTGYKNGNNNAEIKVQMAMSTFKGRNHYLDNWIKTADYVAGGAHVSNSAGSIYNIITIGATNGWNNFATAWNSGLGITRNIEEFKLIQNINFNNGAFTSVGKITGFNKIFNGNGYTMSNIKLTNSNVSSENGTDIVGIFNKIGGGTIKDLTINGVIAENIPAVNTLHLGAFAGQINGGNIENVTLNNINLNGTINNLGYMGGFAGVINSRNGNINIKKVSLNNINKLYLYGTNYTGSKMNMGGFAGKIEGASSGKTNIDGLILNKIGTLQTDVVSGFGSHKNTAIGGFTTELGSGNSINNVYLYFTENSKLAPAAALQDNKDSRNQVSTFYHSMNGNNDLKNINVIYNTMITDPRSPFGNGINDPGYGKIGIGNQGRIYYTAKGMIEGIKQVVEGDANKYGSRVNLDGYLFPENDNYFNGKVKGKYPGVTFNGGNYSWVTWSNISGTYPMNGDLNTSSDYTTLINTYLPQIIDDILEEHYGVTIENADGSSTQATLQDIMNRITNILNAINSGEGEGSADGKITNFLNQILVGDDKTNAELKESIKQSINFLRAFYDGYDNGSKQNAVTKTHASLFANNTAYTNATNKYRDSIKGGMNNLKTTISGQLDSIKTLEETLKLFEEALKKAEELNNQGAQLNTQVENIKNQVAGLDNEIANLQKTISEMEQSGLMRPEYIAANNKEATSKQKLQTLSIIKLKCLKTPIWQI